MSAATYDRRTVLKAIPTAVGACALASACGGSAGSQGTVTVVGGVAAVTFAEFPALETTGGSALIDTSTGARLVVVRTGTTTATVLSSVCTHDGCAVSYSQSANDFQCPCHGSKFALSGQVTQGPATQALKSYVATVVSNAINITVA